MGKCNIRKRRQKTEHANQTLAEENSMKKKLWATAGQQRRNWEKGERLIWEKKKHVREEEEEKNEDQYGRLKMEGETAEWNDMKQCWIWRSMKTEDLTNCWRLQAEEYGYWYEKKMAGHEQVKTNKYEYNIYENRQIIMEYIMWESQWNNGVTL